MQECQAPFNSGWSSWTARGSVRRCRRHSGNGERPPPDIVEGMSDTYRDLPVETNLRDWNADDYRRRRGNVATSAVRRRKSGGFLPKDPPWGKSVRVTPTSNNSACAGKRTRVRIESKDGRVSSPVAILVSATSRASHTSSWTASGHTARVQASVGSHQRARYVRTSAAAARDRPCRLSLSGRWNRRLIGRGEIFGAWGRRLQGVVLKSTLPPH